MINADFPLEERPLCKCHNQPMTPYQNIRHKEGSKAKTHYFRCNIKLNEWQKQNRKKNPEQQYRYNRNARLKKFGITEEDYERMLEEQLGLCKICKAEPDTRWKMLAIDHNHQSGNVRGLLCMSCNTTLGRVEKYLFEFLDYLGVKYE